MTMTEAALTIGDIADAAGVGVETIRYYERRGLVPQPDRMAGAYRRYGKGHVDCIRFIKRAQALGFSLEEVATLLDEELKAILVCPACKGELIFEETRIICPACRKAYPIRDGIPVMLINEAEPWTPASRA